jgi:uncharacterized protein (TIGR02594 family)
MFNQQSLTKQARLLSGNYMEDRQVRADLHHAWRYLLRNKQAKRSQPSYFWLIAIVVFWALVGIMFCKPVKADVVSVAQSQIGAKEIGGNNRGLWVHKYTQGQDVPWCAGFVSWTLRKAGKNTPYTLTAKDYLKIGKRVKSPRKGAIIVFNRKVGGHVGIIEKVEGDRITTIEGNVGKYPAQVTLKTF